jgi:nucleoside-diphosphate-sugar epimerase
MSTEGVDRETFLLGDGETVTWADVYRPVAAALGFELDDLPEAEPPPPAASWRGRWDRARTAASVQAVVSRVPTGLRAAVGSGLGWLSARRQATPWRMPGPPTPAITHEMALLYRCAVKLPHAKASRLLGYTPPITFDEAMRRTVAWLAFAGYPVVAGARPAPPP